MLALDIVFEHPSFSTHPKLLCAAASACKAWREAVQQCSACNTDVVVDLCSSLQHLRSFSGWLCKHAALVRSISISNSCQEFTAATSIHGLQAEEHYRTAFGLLQQAMQMAAPTAALCAAGAPAGQQQHQQGLRMTSYRSGCLSKPGALGALSALPAHSLRQLDLSYRPEGGGTVDASAVSAALARLSSLQQLRLSSAGGAALTGNCLASVPQLSRLTSLVMNFNWCGSAAALQQLLSQPLPLQHSFIMNCDFDEHAVMDLANMTQLTELETLCWDLTEGSVLPAQLQHFQADAPQPCALSALLPLKQLQRLQLFIDFPDQQPLLQLAQLPALQHMSLHYSSVNAAADAAAAWPQLPQLRELELEFFGNTAPLPSQMAAMLGAVTHCSGLTGLVLPVLESPTGCDSGARAVAACGKLAGLTNLRDLHIHWGSKLAPGDVKALTALTGLTRLRLDELGSAVDDAAAAALARSMPQLQDLDLMHCELGSMTCLAEIAKLVHLTSLNIDDFDYKHCICGSLTREGLMQSTGLTRLQQLQLCRNDEVTDEVVDEFWAALRAARSIRCGSSTLTELSSYEAAYDWEMPWYADTLDGA
jgi:hypothetical protein